MTSARGRTAALLLVVLLLGVTQLKAAAELRIPNVKAQAGTKFLVPITLSGGENIAGLQFRLKFDGNVVSAPSGVMPVPGDLLAGHTIGANAEGNELHVVVLSSSLAPFRTGQGTVAYLILQLSASAGAGVTTPLQLVGVQASDAKGENVAVSAHDGSVTNSTHLDSPVDGLNELIFPQVANGAFPGGSFLSNLLVVNRTAATVSARIRFYKSDGSAFSLRLGDGRTGSEFPFTVAEGGSALLQTDGSGELSVGYARLTASAPVGGTILFTQLDAGGKTLVEAGVGASPAGTRFVIPVLYRKGSANTGVAFANATGQATDLTLTLRDKAGLSVETATLHLGPGQHIPKFASELFSQLATRDDFAGVLEAESANPVSAVALKLQGAIMTTFPVISTVYIPPAANPVPTISSISPNTVMVGANAFTLTVAGINFVSGAKVRWNGAERSTTFVSANQLTAAIPASDVAAVVDVSVTVMNPEPGGGVSNGVPFVIGSAPQPHIQVSPASLDFGRLAVGATKQLGLTIQNTGAAPLTVQTITKGSGVFSVSSSPLPCTIVPGGQQAVTVTFAPVAANAISDNLRIASNDPLQPTVSVPMTGSGDAGTAPTVQQATITALANYAFKVDVQLADPDGDVVRLDFVWSKNTMQKTTTINSPADVNLTGFKSGTISYTFQDLGLSTPFGKVSPDHVEIQATDARGLMSNKYGKDM